MKNKYKTKVEQVKKVEQIEEKKKSSRKAKIK
jgi:hypothetical protein